MITKILNDGNLSLNVDKTVFMPFSINKTDSNYNTLTIHSCINNKIFNPHSCKIIKRVSKIRYLCVIFDIKLRWNIHINNLLGKLCFNTYKMVILKTMVPKQTINIVYYALGISMQFLTNMAYWYEVGLKITY